MKKYIIAVLLAALAAIPASAQRINIDVPGLEARASEISNDQSRIRQNMDRLDRTSELYKRYVKKFTDQEDEVDKLRTQIRELTGQETQLRKSLDEYLMGLDLQ